MMGTHAKISSSTTRSAPVAGAHLASGVTAAQRVALCDLAVFCPAMTATDAGIGAKI